MRWLLVCVSLFLSLGLLTLAQAQPPAQPAPSPSFQVRLRYKIEADLQQRYAHYKGMLARLQAVGFVAAPGRPREELYGDSLAGTIPASGVSTLRMERFLRTTVLIPSGLQLPTDIEKTLLVRLDLAITGPDRQKELSDLARQQLKSLGFIENVGYDNQNHTRMLGRLAVPALDVLLKDTMEVTIPSSFKTTSVTASKAPLVRIATVIPEPSPPTPDVSMPSPAPAGREYLDKISPDLKAFLAKVPEGDLDKFMRIELVLSTDHLTDSFRSQLLRSETTYITQGSYGPIVTGLAAPSRLAALAQQSEISTVRLPQQAIPITASHDVLPLGRDLHAPATITPVNYSAPRPPKRLLFIGDDFRGYEKLVGNGLPRNTRFFDVTVELTPDMKPLPVSTAEGIGNSAQLAKEFLAQHPHDEVVLARIDSASPLQLQHLGEAVLGRPWMTPVFSIRKDDWTDARNRLEAERLELRVIRRRNQGDFTLDDATKARRDEYKKRSEAADALEKEHHAWGIRFEQFIKNVQSLKGINTIGVGLQWIDGYTDIPGSVPQLRFLSKEVLRGINWHQFVSSRPRQVWTWLFRDFDGDHIMEFTGSKVYDRPDLAFLAWKPVKGRNETMLPENAVVQVTLNWFEVHAQTAGNGSSYRSPLANLNINVLKQRDPSGTKLPLDAFEVVARTPILADRVENGPRGSHYQTIVRFTVPAGGGRYALQVTGSTPSSTGDASSGEHAEIHPKISLEVVDPIKRPLGKAIFETFATPE